MKTKARGIWANFRTTCSCGAELTITQGRVDHHDCRPSSLAEIQAALSK